jgi:hypothetical protein
MSSHNSRLTSEILRSVVRQIIFKCIKRFKINPLSYDQLMGALPEGRIIPSRPFTCTAIEYMGPFLIKNGHLRTTKTLKSYVAIFVCFATKAVHLELVCDCTSSTFLNALKRCPCPDGVKCRYVILITVPTSKEQIVNFQIYFDHKISHRK